MDGVVEGNALTINIYNEELTLLTTAVYTIAQPQEIVDDNPALTYMDLYFEQGVGFKDDDEGAVTVEGRDVKKYVYLSGKVAVEDVDTVVPASPEAGE